MVILNFTLGKITISLKTHKEELEKETIDSIIKGDKSWYEL